MPLRFTKRILEHLAHGRYEPSAAAAVARDLRVAADDQAAFDAAIRMLADAGRITIGRDRLVRLPSFGQEVVGRLRLTTRGFGFIRTTEPYREGDLFVPAGNTRDAVSGDLVRAEVVRQEWRSKSRSGRSPYIGRIVEVVERGQDQFVGVLARKGGQWMVLPDGRSLQDPVVIRDPHARGAQAGDKVVIELVHYPEDEYLPEGVITKVLGEAGRPDVETQAVIEAHGLRTEFARDSLQEARAATRAFDRAGDDAWVDREDLRDTLVYTIDPPEANDFDDAISIARDEAAKQWTLGVHIADVAHFVPEGGPLDQEARARGNSVYLPRLVIPMLPEVLSNGVCSLQEGVPRLAKSVFITFDDAGTVLGQRVAATVIRSRKRLTYLEAEALIEGDVEEAERHRLGGATADEELIEALRLSERLAKILRARRLRDGMIVLNLPEVELLFDGDGHVVGAMPEDDAFTHTIIEMFMVEANEAVARLFSSLNLPILRRIHPEPVHGDVEELRMYARAVRWRLPDEPTRFDLQKLLDATRESPAARAIHFAVLRTLTKASYSPALIGHFALASADYAHFTSPIRRYPDLSLHRALEAYLEATDNGRAVPKGRERDALARTLAQDDRVLDEGRLIDLGRHCSETEVEAAEAERELRDFLVMQLLQERHLGDTFPGVITGLTGSGVFVSIEEFLVEGLVRSEDMPSSGKRADRWRTDERTGRLVAQRSGLSLGIGDVVTVQIVKVDLASRHLDLAITELPTDLEASPGKRRTGSPREKDARKKRGASKRTQKKRQTGRGRRGRRDR